MNLQSDDFELFGLARRFAQERSAIDARWKELQREAHPDKFAAQGAAALDALEGEVRQARQDALERCATLIDEQHDYTAAAQQVRALMFIARFAQDIERRQDQLGQ